MDFRVHDGQPALYRGRTRVPVALSVCHLLHDDLADLFHRLGSLEGTQRLTMRTATSTGALLTVVTGRVPDRAPGWGAGVVVRKGRRTTVVHGQGHIVEEVAGHRFRISGGAFFQNNTAGAGALVALVDEALGVQTDDVMLDAYAGGGLFTVTVGSRASDAIAVEVADDSLGDLRVNLAFAGMERAGVVAGSVESAVPRLAKRWTIAVVDPPRSGLGAGGVGAVTRTRPRAIAYVSCDPASLARDAALLGKAGYDVDWVAPVDMFPQTFHTEAVARFTLR